MKRAVSTFGVLAVLFAIVSLSAPAADTTWTGWISDSHCGAKGMNAAHKACAETCVTKNGSKWVFVDSKDSKVYPITNQDAVKADSDLGHEVTVNGMINNDGSLKISSIKEANKSS